MRIVLYLVWKEYLQIVRDRATLFQVLAIPMVQLVVLSFAATFQIRETQMHLVDLDRSAASRDLVDSFESSGFFRVTGASASIQLADDALLSREADLVLHIPDGFARDIVRERHGRVQLVINAEQGAAAGILRSYAAGILSDYAAELSAERAPASLASAPASRSGQTSANPPPRIEIRTRGRYNPQLEYIDYMVPGILVALVTLIGTLLTAQNIAREKELGTLEQLNVTPVTRTQFIAGKLIPFWILGIVELAAGLALARFVFEIPFRGSLPLVFVVAAVYLVAALGIGLLISTLADTQQQAMFVTFFLMMIYLLMSGLYTPISSMPGWVRWLAELNPVKHFVLVMRSVLVKGAGFRDIIMPFAVLIAFAAITLVFAIRRYSKRMA